MMPSKINLCSKQVSFKSSDNGKQFIIRKKTGNRLTDVENQRYSLEMQSLRFRNFFSKKNFDTRFEISLFCTMNMSSYMQSEQPSLAGKHLRDLLKNSMAVVTYIATLLRRPPKLLAGSATTAAVAGYLISNKKQQQTTC